MNVYHGIIEILLIENICITDETASFTEFKINNIRVVHYPDSQQLIIWLPQHGNCYQNIKLKNSKNDIISDSPVADYLNGSIQIIWDTLSISPDEYVMEIDGKSFTGQHKISFVKHEEGILINIKENLIPIVKDIDKINSKPIVYKNADNKEIINEDLLIIKKLKKKIEGNFKRKIEYMGNFRAGSIIYIDEDIRISFDHEMGGGNCMFFVFIPSEEIWERETKTPLSERNDILQFIAETLKREQASNCRYEIKSNEISFYNY